MLCLVLWIGECRLRTAKGKRQCTDRGPKLGPKAAPEASKRSPRGFEKGPKRAQRPTTGPRQLQKVLSSLFRTLGRTAQKMATNRPDLTAEAAQKASPTEDSTRTVEQSAGTPEIRPSTADGRLEEGSETTGN